jgi:hypothetical protein
MLGKVHPSMFGQLHQSMLGKLHASMFGQFHLASSANAWPGHQSMLGLVISQCLAWSSVNAWPPFSFYAWPTFFINAGYLHQSVLDSST